MGTNVAPYLANLYLYSYESGFLDRQDVTTARKYVGVFRYIDDLLSSDNPCLQDQLDANNIYPAFLQLNATSSSQLETEFLGMQVRGYGEEIELDVADSKKKFPFAKINYPSLRGNFPSVLGYGVFTGQLHRFFRICTRPSDFAYWCALLANVLLTKDYALKKLKIFFNAFITGKKKFAIRTRHLYRMFCFFLRHGSGL